MQIIASILWVNMALQSSLFSFLGWRLSRADTPEWEPLSHAVFCSCCEETPMCPPFLAPSLDASMLPDEVKPSGNCVVCVCYVCTRKTLQMCMYIAERKRVNIQLNNLLRRHNEISKRLSQHNQWHNLKFHSTSMNEYSNGSFKSVSSFKWIKIAKCSTRGYGHWACMDHIECNIHYRSCLASAD